MKHLSLFALMLGLSMGMALPANGASDTPKRGGTLTMAIRKDLTTLHPLIRTSSTNRSIRDLMFEPLLGLDSKGNIQPYLAQSWDVSKDGTVYTFHLRKGVKFHDGREMTAEDAKFAMDYSLNPKNGASGIKKLRLVKSVEAADKYTLKVAIKKASPAFLTFLTNISAFSVIPKESLKEGVRNPKTSPPGTGPFRFVEWKTKRRIVFERFDEYWGNKAFVDRLVLRPISNSTVRFTALRTGDVDIVERTSYEWVKMVVKGKIKGVGFAKAPYAGFRRLSFNLGSPPFNNEKLRQAVAHAIEKEEILHAAYFGFGEPTDQKYPKGHAWYFAVPAPSYDLEKAKALLKEADYKGQTVSLLLRQGEDQMTEGTVIQAQLKKIGIKVKLDVNDYSAYNARQRKGEFDFVIRGGSFDPDPTLVYGPDLMCVDLKRRISNYSGYCDQEMEALLNNAETELDSKVRRAQFKQVLTKLGKDVPFLPIGFVPRFFTMRDYVKGFTTDARGAFRPWGAGLNHVWLEK